MDAPNVPPAMVDLPIPKPVVPRPPRRTVARWLPPLVVAAWAGATVAGFWWFGAKDRRPLDAAAVAAWFDATAHGAAAERWLRESLGPAWSSMPAATVVALETPDCTCSRAAARHVQRIEAAYAPRGVRFASARVGDASPDALAAPEWATAAPAALVFDGAGRLVYFGPLSDEGNCGAARTGFVERALDATLAGTAMPGHAGSLRPLLGVGCFCVRSTTA